MRKYRYVGQVGKLILIGNFLIAMFTLPIFKQMAAAVALQSLNVEQVPAHEWSIPLQLGTNPLKEGQVKPPSTAAKSAALIDVSTGRLLYSHNGDVELAMASTTKIMTAIVAIEHNRLDDIVKISAHAIGKEGSSLYLRLGEEISMHHLLYGLMLRSGNDAAVAIAEYVGGSEEGFVYLMNEKAKLIGLRHTKFRNPHGLDEVDHYTTASDLARLSAYALRNPSFREIVRTRTKRVPNSMNKWDYVWRNKNKMLRLYEGADGVKTGYTRKALRCLVSSATRNGQQLVAVTLNDSRDWEDHKHMLDYGFRTFPQTMIIEQGQRIAGHPYESVAFIKYPLRVEEQSRITAKLIIPTRGSLEQRLGHRGRLIVSLDNKPIKSVEVRTKGQEKQKQHNRSLHVPIKETSASFWSGKGSNLLHTWLLSLERVTDSLFGTI